MIGENIYNKTIQEAKSYLSRGKYYYKISELDKALSDFEKAYSLNENLNEAMYWLCRVNIVFEIFNKGLFYLEKLKKSPYNREELEKLNKAVYEQYLAYLKREGIVMPQNKEEAYNEANALYQTENYSECIKFIHQAVANDFESIDLNYVYGKALIKNNSFHVAIKIAERVLEECEDYRFYELLGEANYYVGNYKDATEMYLKAIELNEDNFELYYNLSNCKMRVAEYNDAIIYAEKAITLNKYNGYYYINKIDALLELNRYDEALDICNSAISYDDKNVELFKRKMKILTLMGKFKEAMNRYSDILALGFNKEDIDEMKVKCLLIYGNVNEALAVASNKELLDPKFNYDVALAYFDMEEFSKADKYFEIARSLEEDNDKVTL